eukprot:TRINITY_DN102100_c0_g1_i1.p1 TRINITY_DN102100_c0_g1~~TRINITY_DN102100_c0_g1_i1.p1  ORF type:complete len:380 (+),score=119.58 TRINITY_DN102100_c0_g1_i1:76-1215(+)
MSMSGANDVESTSPPEPQPEDTPPDPEEARLTEAVPGLLEAMNRASEEVNSLERQLGESTEKHRRLFEAWGRVQSDVKKRHGGAGLSRVRPYFDASQAADAASERAQAAARSFLSAAKSHTQAKAELNALETRLVWTSSLTTSVCSETGKGLYNYQQVSLSGEEQERLSRATLRVERCQEERDHCELESARAVFDFQEAQRTADSLKRQLSEEVIRKSLPALKILHDQQLALVAERRRGQELAEKAAAAKRSYGSCMSELDRISGQVHEFRRAQAQLQEAREESPPEVSPEVSPRRSRAQQETLWKKLSGQANAGRPGTFVFGDDSPPPTPNIVPCKAAPKAKASTLASMMSSGGELRLPRVEDDSDLEQVRRNSPFFF